MEVLVSVIILAMSMAIVFYVLQNVQKTQCVSELKSATLAMQNALIDVALGSPPTTRKVFYKMPECSGTSVEALRFSYYADRAYCRTCPGSYSGCWLIEPLVYDYKQDSLYRLVDAVTCVDMPADIELAIEDNQNKCLSDHLSTSFCPAFSPGASTSFVCEAKTAGSVAQVFYGTGQNPRRDGAGQEIARTRTFVKRPSEKTFFFEFTKQVGPSNTGTVQICPCQCASCQKKDASGQCPS